jgi:hypothetical protein
MTELARASSKKENFHIYHLNKTNMLIEEKKPNEDNHSQH